MTNPYYNHTTYPAQGSQGSSANMRSELDAIAAGFNLLPVLSGNSTAFVRVDDNGTSIVPTTHLFEVNNGIAIGTSALTSGYALQVNGIAKIQTLETVNISVFDAGFSLPNNVFAYVSRTGGSGNYAVLGNSPSNVLVIGDVTNTVSGGTTAIYSNAGTSFLVNGTTVGTIGANGNVHIGSTSAPFAWGSNYRAISVTDPSSSLYANGPNHVGVGENHLINSAGNTVYGASSAAAFYEIATGIHAWFTAPSGTAGAVMSAAQVMTLDNSGNLLIGTTTLGNADHYDVQVQVASGAMRYQHATAATSGAVYLQFNYAGGQIGSITQSGTTAVLYNTTSDYRLKANQQPLAYDSTWVDRLQPTSWTWADGCLGTGFIAHEFAEVSPTSVHGTKDAVDAEGNPVYQAIDPATPEVIARLVSELQHLRARVAVLEGRP